jgi:hypothetical protein
VLRTPEVAMDPMYAPRTPSPVPEALFSATLKGTLNGHETMLTARGMTPVEFRRNLDAIRDLLDPCAAAPSPATAPAALPPAGVETPICPYHGAMKVSAKAPGTFFCPSRMGDGSYCREKHP